MSSKRRRRRSSSSDRMIEAERETSVFTRSFSSPALTYIPRSLDDLLDLVSVEDNRLWSPEVSYGKDVDGQSSVIQERKRSSRGQSMYGIFEYGRPDSVVTCIRRKERREVLHALRRTRKGSGAGKRRRTDKSNVRC